MSLAVIELADPGVVAFTEGGVLAGPSPGMALLDGGTVTVGRAAAARRRLLPRRIHARYWEQLDTTPLPKPHPGHLSTADLAHAQLVELWSSIGQLTDAVVVATPSTFDRRQLGLVLGIAEASAIPVHGMVDSAVAATVATSLLRGTIVHLDILLHRVVVSRIEAGPMLTLTRIDTDEAVGLLGFEDSWARSIAAAFVRSTRFDPLKLAESEQRLYDSLPELISQARSRELLELRSNAGGRNFEIQLPAAALEDAGRGHVRRIVGLVTDPGASPPDALLLSHRAAVIPGLATALQSELATPIHTADPLATVRGAIARAHQIVSDPGEITFVSKLSANGPTTASHHESAS